MKSPTWFISVLLMISVAACAADAFPPEFVPKPAKRIVASEDEYYGPAEPVIKKLLLAEMKNNQTSHFCVVGYEFPNRTATVWVHWQEAQRLLLWRDSSDPELREQGLVYAQRDLKLGKDTVEATAQIKGSTYLVTRARWEAVAKDCAAHGQKYTIQAFSASEK